MASFEEQLFESFSLTQKIETQRIMLDLISSEIRITEDDFWAEVLVLVERIRDLSGQMEDRLDAFRVGVIDIQQRSQEQIKERSVRCYREAVMRVAEADRGDGTLH